MPPPLPHVDGVEHHAVLARGIRLHVATAGSPAGPPVILQHGWPQHWYEWRHLIGPLAEAGYRVIVPDLRGLGWSEYPPDEDFRKETFADDLVALCDTLGITRVRLVGHDWGAWAGWLLCLRRPDLIERAVLLSAPPPFPPDTIEPAALKRLGRLAYQVPIATPMPHAAKLAWFRNMGKLLGGKPPDELEAYAEPLAQRSQTRASMLLYRQFLTREMPELLARKYAGQRLTVPVRFLVGEEDLFYYEGLENEAAAHADAPYEGEVLRGVGHFIPDEARDLLRERVLGFLDQELASTSPLKNSMSAS
jgi:pimeloyl-ACP methyl ester carboxylesterase